MAERKFKLGDTVKLKSGGPNMTVQYYIGSKLELMCSWFGENNQLQRDKFHEDSLEKV